MVYYHVQNGYSATNTLNYGYSPLTNTTASLPPTPVTPVTPGLTPTGAPGLNTGPGLLATPPAAPPGCLPLAPTSAAAASAFLQKMVIPHLSPSQVNFLFKNRMDKKRYQKPVQCETCGISLNSDQQAQQHYSGKSHLKMLRKQGKPIPEEYQGKIKAVLEKEADKKQALEAKIAAANGQPVPRPTPEAVPEVPPLGILPPPPPPPIQEKVVPPPSYQGTGNGFNKAGYKRPFQTGFGTATNSQHQGGFGSGSNNQIQSGFRPGNNQYQGGLGVGDNNQFQGSFGMGDNNQVQSGFGMGDNNQVHSGFGMGNNNQFQGGFGNHNSNQFQGSYDQGNNNQFQGGYGMPDQHQFQADFGTGNDYPTNYGIGSNDDFQGNSGMVNENPVQAAVYANIQGGLPKSEKKKKVFDPNKMGLVRCDVCQENMLGQNQYQAHLAGKKHAKRLKYANLNNGTSTADSPFQSKHIVKSGAGYECTLCNAMFNGPAPTEMHVNGEKHKRKLDPEAYAEAKKRKQDTDTGPTDPSNTQTTTPTATTADFLDPKITDTTAPTTSAVADSSSLSAVDKAVPIVSARMTASGDKIVTGDMIGGAPTGVGGDKTGLIAGEVEGTRTGWLYCRLCNLSVCNTTKLQLHCTSSHHKKKQNEQQNKS